MNSTITQAAEVVQNRLTLSPELMTDATTGGAFNPGADLENALLEDYDLNWVIISDGATGTANQDFGFQSATGDDQTVRVQFLTKATTEAIATGTTCSCFRLVVGYRQGCPYPSPKHRRSVGLRVDSDAP